MAACVTKKQMRIFDAIMRLREKRNFRPTYREIAAEAGAELSYVHATVKSLAKKGMVFRGCQRRHRTVKPNLREVKD